ncbi:MAG: DNA methyltransferase [Candidatus Sumerlaeia bacterium]|nr:DNA methyltransferase [Candidatus Sumerlaeia bacterium]
MIVRTFKPLFRPEVIRDRLLRFPMPPGVEEPRRRLASLASLFATGDPGRLGEENLKPGFLADVFGELLGYRTPNQAPGAHTIVPEFALRTGGFADAVLGRQLAEGRGAVVAVEIKGPRDPLDIPHGGRRLSAVEQGFDYAINLGCDWIVVSSMRETRLYHKGADRLTCERFDLALLATNDHALRRFLYILGAERVLAPDGSCHLEELLAESKRVGERLTREFYEEFSRHRLETFLRLGEANPGADRVRLLALTQKILDRVLFCAFAEDRGLLPKDSVREAFTYRNPYTPQPVWNNFRALFRFINDGNPDLNIPRYNGGLFAPDPEIDALAVPDMACSAFPELARYDFRELDTGGEEALAFETNGREGVIDVEILGHIFEQSITDLERLRLEIEETGRLEPPDPKRAKAKRKKEGAFYTPRFITSHIVERTLGPVLADRCEQVRARHHAEAKGAARAALADPAAAEPALLRPAAREALVRFWREWRDELGTIRVLDPACGSGAFLIEVYDQLLAAYRDANARLEALGCDPELFDLSRRILERNLYGVDVNSEAVEICRLSLWIKTAERGKILTDLDHTIRRGNSIVDDPALHPWALDWRAAFPEVFEGGGFDAVVGNPPYIRQEWIAAYKEHLKSRYASFSGTADIYIYFIERGLDLLREGGRLGFITSGTFARGNFAAPFRKWLPGVARFSSLVNFGENQPFEGAEMVYPTMFTLEKRTGPATFPTLFLDEKIPKDISKTMEEHQLPCDESVFESEEWKFQPKDVTALFRKLSGAGVPLAEAVKGRIYYGIKTGLNEAFIIDTPTRDALVAADARSAEIIRPILKGEDLRPWHQDWEGNHLLAIPSGMTRQLAGPDVDECGGWRWFATEFHAVAEHLARHETTARLRQDKGDFWWELRPCSYYSEFDQPKILWPDIQKLPRFSWDATGFYVNDKGFILLAGSASTLSLLNSHTLWFCISQLCLPLRLRKGLWQYQSKSQFIERLPIPALSAEDDAALARIAEEVTDFARERHALHRATRHRIVADLLPRDARATNAITTWWELDLRALREELARAAKSDIPVRERADWEAFLATQRTAHERLTAAIVSREEELNDRVYRLYGLSAAEVRMLEDFMRRTKTFYPLGEV